MTPTKRALIERRLAQGTLDPPTLPVAVRQWVADDRSLRWIARRITALTDVPVSPTQVARWRDEDAA